MNETIYVLWMIVCFFFMKIYRYFNMQSRDNTYPWMPSKSQHLHLTKFWISFQKLSDKRHTNRDGEQNKENKVTIYT